MPIALGLALQHLHLDRLDHTVLGIPLGIAWAHVGQALGVLVTRGAAVAFGPHDGVEGVEALLDEEHAGVVEIIGLHRPRLVGAEHPARVDGLQTPPPGGRAVRFR